MYIFKYHPDNVIYRNGSYVGTYAEFMGLNPEFPLKEGQYLEYRSDGLDLINSVGGHVPQDISQHSALIQAIEALNE